jgi:GNAT superfamily N-acetyltransferase
MQVREIQAEQTWDLRSRILRPGQSFDACKMPEDHLPTTFHLGIFEDGRIICNGTFMKQGHEHFPQALHPYRLRGMASDSLLQKKGLGSTLIQAALEKLKEKKCDLLWFNARTSAEGFYRKLEFQEFDTVFDIPGIGPHRVMYRWLK